MTFRSCRLMVQVGVVATLLSAGQSMAGGRCDELQSQLSDLPVATEAKGDSRQYSNAISQQNLELRGARSDLRRLGCGAGSVSSYGSAGNDECGTIQSSVNEMERNLRSLEGQRTDLAYAERDRAARDEVLRELEANGCDETAAINSAGEDEPDANVRYEEEPLGDDGYPTRYDNVGGAPRGGFKTVCVRTCDGGFFPITNGASPMDFRRDQRLCARMCPQTETELFYQGLNAADSADMISTVTGQPYSELPTAFAYRARDFSKPQTCGCDLASYYRQAAGGRSIPLSGTDSGSGLGAAPATTSKNVGSVTTIRMRPVGKAAETSNVVVERPYDPANNKVRNVGPVFLPDEENTIDLRNPAGPK